MVREPHDPGMVAVALEVDTLVVHLEGGAGDLVGTFVGSRHRSVDAGVQVKGWDFFWMKLVESMRKLAYIPIHYAIPLLTQGTRRPAFE
jgi:hypothetical protein